VFKQFKKLLKDTTQVGGSYVAKDVRNQVAFVNGLILSYLASVKSDHIQNEYASIGAGTLLAYSLGAAVVKSYYQTKNNAIAADSSCAPAPGIETPGTEAEKA
jgi:hypothetical protein